MSEKKSYACTYENCSATFQKRGRYRTHLLEHTGERPFICTFDGCDKTYKRPSHLKRHEETHERMFKCTLPGCSQILKTKATLMKHQDVFHTKKEAKIFKCSECNEQFSKRSMLARHSYTHSGIKAYKCSEPGCDKSYSMPSLLKRHKKRHVGYFCEESDCSKFFPRWSLLRKHKKECHSKIFRCQICEKIFKYACNLKAHSLTHKLEKDIFRCTVPKCIRFYSAEKNLSAHMKTFHETYTLACPEGNCHRFVKTEKELEIHIQHRHRRRQKKKKIPRKPEFAEILSGFAKGTKKDLNPHLSNIVLEEEFQDSVGETMELEEGTYLNSSNATQEQSDKQCLDAQCSQNTEDETLDIKETCFGSSGTTQNDKKQCLVNDEYTKVGLNPQISNIVFDEKVESKDVNIKSMCLDPSIIIQNNKNNNRSIDVPGSKLKLPLLKAGFETKIKKSKDEFIEVEVICQSLLASSQNDEDYCLDGENCINCTADQLWISSDMPTGKVT